MQHLKISMSISKSSPLYEYWHSDQNQKDEEKRLLKLNSDRNYEAGSLLFETEPYKWEILYQSIVREVIKNEKNSKRALKKILFTIESNSRTETLNILESQKVLTGSTIEELKSTSLEELKNLLESKHEKSSNIKSFLRILFAIFTNPYGIEIKNEKSRIYERSGYLMHSIKRILAVNNNR